MRHLLTDFFPEPATTPPPRADLPKRTWPFLFHFFGQVRAPLAVLVVLWTISSAMYAILPLFTGAFVEAASVPQGQETPTTFSPLLTIGALFLGALMIKYSFDIVGYVIFANLAPRFLNIARRQLALYLHGHSYRYFQRDFAGRLAGKVVEMPQAMVDVIYILTEPLLFGLIMFSLSVLVLLSAHPVFAVMLLVWIGLYVMALRACIPRIARKSEEAAISRSVVRGRFVDTITNILTVKLFARARHEDSYLTDALTDHTRKGVSARLAVARLSAAIYANWLVYWCVGLGVFVIGYDQGWIGANDIAIVLQNSAQLFGISFWISNEMSHLFEKLGEIKEGIDQITTEHDVTDAPVAHPIRITQGHIRLNAVRFAYPGRSVFQGLTLDVPPGQKIGLVGPSGAGKSTLTQLMLRLYDLQGGSIDIDGQDIARVTQESLRASVGVIPQHTDLLHRSIADNIRYGRIDADDAAVVAAATAAFADGFIRDLRDDHGNAGYNALVGERGVRLSGGQRQRIAIARVIVKNAPILILDEATSSLDSESEELIQQALRPVMQGKTVIAIAHRLSTIMQMDRLLVMDQGQIIEDGTHAQLLAQGGLYARLWGLQSRGFLSTAPRMMVDSP